MKQYKIALIYCRESEEDRKSKEKDKERRKIELSKAVSTSIKNQEKYGRDEAGKEGIKEVHVFKDVNVKSTVNKRKGFNALLSFVKDSISSEIRVFIKNYRRLGRGSTFLDLRRKLVNLGVSKEQIFFYHDPHHNRINNESDAIVMIKTGADLLTIESGRLETKELHTNKQEEGKPYIKPPFGYKYNKEKNWVIVEKEAKIVREVLKLSRNGVKSVGISKSLCLDKGKVYRIIKNEMKYKGVIFYDKKIKNDIGEVVRIERIEYKGNYDAILN